MKRNLLKIFMIVLSVCMIMTSFAGCNSEKTTSTGGDEVIVNSETVNTDDTDVSQTEATDSQDETASTDSQEETTSTTSKKETTSTTSNKGTTSTTSKKETTSTTSKTETTSKITETNTGAFDPYEGIEKYKGKTVKVLLWFTPSKSEKASIAAFEEKYGIKVKIESTANDADVYATRLAEIISAGESCDVCLVSNSTLFAFAKNILKSVESVKTFQADDPAYDLEQMNQLKVRGKLYGINVKGSWQTDEEIMYYNPNAFKNKGVKSPGDYYKEGNWNWDTFLECAKAMTYEDNGTKYYGYTATKWYTFINSAGTDLVTYDGATLTNNINDTTLLKAMTFTNELYNKYKVCSTFYDVSGFSNGTVAMFSNLTYSMTKEQTAFSDLASGVAVDAVPFPSPKGSTVYTPASSKAFGIMKSAENPEAAIYFIRWFLDPENDNREYINDSFATLREQVSQAENKVSPFAPAVFNYGSSINYEQFLYDCIYNADSQQITTTAQRYAKILETAMKKSTKIASK